MFRASSSREASTLTVEELEPRVLLSAHTGVSAAAPGFAHITAIVQRVSSIVNSPPSGAYTPSQIRTAYTGVSNSDNITNLNNSSLGKEKGP